MKRTRKYTTPVIICLMGILLSSLVLTGCSGAKSLTSGQKDAVLAYSEPIADNLLQGMNADSYKAFSRDFDPQMQQGLPQSNFKDKLFPTINGKFGKYISRQVASVNTVGKNVVIVYTAKFERSDNVTITLTLKQQEPHQVAGLYFK
ncbi:MAG: DUF3887 domain-containing protein [Anaerolineales bacterium]|jgi:hypothetical protein